MNTILRLTFFLTVFFVYSEEKFFTIIVPSYNNISWYTKNLDSIFTQQYSNYNVIYIDDCSTDGTGQKVQEYIAEHGLKDKCTFIRNETNQGALFNIYKAVHSCSNDRIIVTVDGDDWLAHENVLSYLNELYSDENVWISYGQYQTSAGGVSCCSPYQEIIIENHTYRESMWRASHLRVFYAGLFKKIALKDFLYDNQFFKVSWDLSFMYPMIELASGRYKCAEDVLYIYNTNNPISDHRIDLNKQLYYHFLIANKNRYKALESKEDFIEEPGQNFTHIVFIENQNNIDEYLSLINVLSENPLCKKIMIFTTVGFPRDQLISRTGSKVFVPDCSYFSNDLFNNENYTFANKFIKAVQLIDTDYTIFSRNLDLLHTQFNYSQVMGDLFRTDALAGIVPGQITGQACCTSDVAVYGAEYSAQPSHLSDLIVEKNFFTSSMAVVVKTDIFKDCVKQARIIGGFNSIVASFEREYENVCLWYQKK